MAHGENYQWSSQTNISFQSQKNEEKVIIFSFGHASETYKLESPKIYFLWKAEQTVEECTNMSIYDNRGHH